VNGFGVVLSDKSQKEQNIDSRLKKPQEISSLMNIPSLNIRELYRGEFENGMSHGLGVQTFDSEKTYIGLFKEGKPEGYGTWKNRLKWELCNSKNGGIDGIVISGQKTKILQVSEYKSAKLHGYTIVMPDEYLEHKLLQIYAKDDLTFQTEL
jgi:hypothetical protein